MSDPYEDSFKKEIREQVYAIQAEAEFDTTVRLLRRVTENFGVSIDTAFDKLEIGMEVRPRYREKLEQVPDFWETVHRMANMKSIILYNTKKNGMPYPSIKSKREIEPRVFSLQFIEYIDAMNWRFFHERIKTEFEYLFFFC